MAATAVAASFSTAWALAAGGGGLLLAAALALVAAALWRRLERVGRAEHELRGPVTALCLGLEALRREPAARSRAAALDVEIERLRSGLAWLAAARAGKPEAGPSEAIPLEEVVRSAAAAWEPAARRLGRQLRLDWGAGRVSVRADRGRLAQAFGNLVSNAVEHGRGTVELRGRRAAGGGVRIEVRDAGPGIARPRRGLPRRGRFRGVAGGRGLGLSIASDAIESAGGRVSAERSDGGSAVAAELPVVEQ